MRRTAHLLAALTLLPACSMDPATPQPPPEAAQSACLRDVAAVSGTADLVILDTRTTGGGMAVTLATGLNGPRWSCEVRPDGRTFAIHPLTA